MKNYPGNNVLDAFERAVLMDDGRRQAYLNDLKSHDRETYREVISLLSADRLESVLPRSSAHFDAFMESGRNVFSADTKEQDFFVASERRAPVGEIINNRYAILKRLGSGGMGDVYLALDRNVMDREVVVKLLKSETLANAEVVRKFRQEIEALARLKDPGIVTILDSGTYGKQPFLVLEYVEGEDLALIISPLLFSVRDFVNPLRLADVLRQQETVAARHFWRKLTPEGRDFLETMAAERNDTAKVLRDEFARLLSDPGLYDQNLFDDFEIETVIKEVEKTGDLSSLPKANRALIENTFPGEIICGSEKRLTAAEAALVFRQVGASLVHGHNKGIIHRDLKPANIMIAENERGEWRTKLIDFGVAKVRESLVAPTTEIGLSFGTRKYMSPEQINGKSNLTPASDIYALGLIAFEALTGQHIFNTDSFIEQCRMQEKEEFSEITRLRPDLSPRVKEIICRAVSFNPANRQQSAAEFGNALADALSLPVTEPAKTEPSFSIDKKLTEAETDVLDRREDFVIAAPGKERPRSGNKRLLPVAAGAFLFLLMFVAAGWFIWQNAGDGQNAGNAPAVTETIKRELNYKLIVQKYYEGKPFQQPFEATGDEIFGDGWRFRMQTNSPQSGNLYLLTENQNTKNLTMLFPHPQRNEGKSEVAANEKIETAEMAFDKNQGTEKFWIVWAASPIGELEAVKSFVNPQDLGRIKDAEKEKTVRAFLDKAGEMGKLTEKTAGDKLSKKLMTTGDVLVKMAEFRHN